MLYVSGYKGELYERRIGTAHVYLARQLLLIPLGLILQTVRLCAWAFGSQVDRSFIGHIPDD